MTVTQASATSLRVTWNAVAGTVLYYVHWKSPGEQYSLGRSQGGGLGPSTLSYTITNLTPGTYTVRVQAADNNSFLARSEVTITLGAAVPNITVTDTGPTSVRVSWDVVGEIIKSNGNPNGAWPQYSYDLYYKSGSESYSNLRLATVYTGNNHPNRRPYADITGLTRGQTYTVRVRASTIDLQFDDQGNELNMARQTFTAQSEVTFTKGSVNYVPTFDDGTPYGTPNGAGPAQTATAGEPFSYTAPAATDRDGHTIAYTAALADGSGLPGWLTFNPATRTFSGAPGADDAPAEHGVVMTATDDYKHPGAGTWSFALTVAAADGEADDGGTPEEAVPTPPRADAGADKTGKRGGAVTLAGAGTRHARGSQDALTYSWRIKNASHAELKAGTAWLSNANQATATFSVPRRKGLTDRRAVDNGQTIDFELTVTDGDNETATDTVTVTIQGTTWKAVRVSVADASAEETAGAIAFTVTLSQAARDAVSVDYKTSDGTALAGLDYTAASGTLTFQPGQTSQTVSVTLNDDLIDDTGETFTLTLEHPVPAGTLQLADATATGTITNADPLQTDWLARFGRAATLAPQSQWPDGATPDGRRPPGQTLNVGEVLRGSSFRAVFAADALTGAQWTGWGQGAAASQFSSAGPGLTLTGQAATGAMGMDYERGPLLTGFALTHSLGTGTAAGAGRRYRLESAVTVVLPYARVALSDRVTAWGLAGTGRGRMTLAPEGGPGERHRADLAMTLAAAGVKGDLLTPAAAGGVTLALKADAFWVRTESESVSELGVGNLAGARTDASRVRLALTGTRTLTLAGARTLTPSLELGLRHDGGDAETGMGLEFGAGLGYRDPASGLDVALRGWGLAAHMDGGYREWGVSGSLRYVPDAAGRGLSASLTPAFGAEAGGTDLWHARDATALAQPAGSAVRAARLDMELGYGFGSPAFTGTVTPYTGLALMGPAGRTLRVGPERPAQPGGRTPRGRGRPREPRRPAALRLAMVGVGDRQGRPFDFRRVAPYAQGERIISRSPFSSRHPCLSF